MAKSVVWDVGPLIGDLNLDTVNRQARRSIYVPVDITRACWSEPADGCSRTSFVDANEVCGAYTDDGVGTRGDDGDGGFYDAPSSHDA
jgi:hypothetical protein